MSLQRSTAISPIDINWKTHIHRNLSIKMNTLLTLLPNFAEFYEQKVTVFVYSEYFFIFSNLFDRRQSKQRQIPEENSELVVIWK